MNCHDMKTSYSTYESRFEDAASIRRGDVLPDATSPVQHFKNPRLIFDREHRFLRRNGKQATDDPSPMKLICKSAGCYRGRKLTTEVWLRGHSGSYPNHLVSPFSAIR